jgi:hypothetical protein
MPQSQVLWTFLVWGYFFTVAVEIPVLLVGLSRPHPPTRRLLAGFWLTACTYPIVVLVLPPLVWSWSSRALYLAVAEVFAPLAECGLFYAAFLRGTKPARWHLIQDMAAIVLANLASFGLGELLIALNWLPW